MGYVYDIPDHLPQNDKQVLREAIDRPSDYSFDDLYARAVTEECRKQIHDIEIHKYHRAEYRAGLL